jgi:hypothetical protein
MEEHGDDTEETIDEEQNESDVDENVLDRFDDVVDDLDFYIDGHTNPKTKAKTKTHKNLLQMFLKTKEEDRKIEDILHENLDKYLGIFFVSVRKQHGDRGNDRNYEPSALKSIQSSFERYLREQNYPKSIIKDHEFFHSREALRSRCRELKKLGKGNLPCRKRPPTQLEIDQLWAKGSLGDGSPEALQHSIWWIMDTRFGVRANTENHKMEWGDLSIGRNSEGRKYLVRNERDTKTRTGEAISEHRENIRVYEDVEHSEFCPVRLFEEYACRRPQEYCQPESSLYIQPKKFKSIQNMRQE